MTGPGRDRVVVLAGALLVPLLGVLASGLTGALLLRAGVPAASTLLLSFLVAALVALLGARAVTARATEDLAPFSLVGPLLLAALLVLPGTAPLWLRSAVTVLVVGAGLLGLRLGTAADVRPRAPLRRGDRGAGTLEFVGVVVLAGVLTAAAIAAVVASSPGLSDTIARVICQITGGSCTGPGGRALTDDDVLPEDCDVYTEGKSVSTVVDVAFVRLGGSAGLERVEKSDGTIEISLTDRGEGGLVASAGGRGSLTLGSRDYAAALEAEAAATLGVLSGQTWTFRDRESADAFQSYAQRELAEDVITSTSPVLGLVNTVVEHVTGESAPSNDGVQRTVLRGDVSGTAEASAGFGYGAGGRLAGGFTTALGAEFDRGADPDDPADDTRTDFVQVDWEVAGTLGVPVVKGIGGSTAASGILKVTRDARGDVVRVAVVDRSTGDFDGGFIAEQGWLVPPGGDGPVAGLDGAVLDFRGGPSSSVVVTRSLDLTTADQRRAFGDWLSGGGASATTAGQVVPGIDTVDGGVAAGWGGQEFAERLRREGRTSVVEYDGTSWGLGGALEGGLGLKAGLELGYDSSEASAVTAYYLGAPDAAGDRPHYPLPQCVR